ncbi:EF-hand domain-containing protein [Marinoscillum sp. MHG1-6]|uniref:EF-hand domain-containing protein n=1 Tax=Marinoscillum sp. MHG1-6 TaxID=2959627 RepID=UPI0021583DD4|nr:hypothetical protein [Marinoscillum sp. MHG1-6]
MLSEFQSTKFKHLFNLLDINDNGIIQKNDFTLLAERVAPFVNGKIDSKAYNQLVYRGMTFYNRLIKSLEPSDPSRIGMHEWVKYIDKEIIESGDQDNLAELTQLLLGFIFGLFDENHDGFLSLEEYQEIFQVLSIDDSKASLLYEKLDSNSDDRLSRYELVLAVEGFLTSDDPSELGNWIFGDYQS